MHKFITFLSCIFLVMALCSCHSFLESKDTNQLEESMRDACTKHVVEMYAVLATAIKHSDVIQNDSDGKEILNGVVDKGPEGQKKYRCIYTASHTLADVMAMTSDGE